MGFKFKSRGCVFALIIQLLVTISVAKVTDPSEGALLFVFILGFRSPFVSSSCLLPLLLSKSYFYFVSNLNYVFFFFIFCVVSALIAVRGSLVDPLNHLRNWNKGDPCTSNWTGVICVHKTSVHKYWHVQELYVFMPFLYFFMSHFGLYDPIFVLFLVYRQLLNMNLSGSLAPELGQFPHLKIL